MLRCFFNTVVFCFFYTTIFSQQYQVTNYTTKQGLSSNTIYMMAEDTVGRLWISTENGLCVFDGHEFKSYNAADKLPENTTVFLKMLPHNQLFFTTQTKGAFIKNKNNFERPNAYCIKGMASANYINNSNFLIGYGQNNKSIVVYPLNQFYNYNYKYTRVKATASSALFLNNSEVLLGTDKGVLKMNIKDTSVNQFKVFINKPNSTNLCDDKQFLYFTQNQTIYKFNKSSLTIVDSLKLDSKFGFPKRMKILDGYLYLITNTPNYLLKINPNHITINDSTIFFNLKNNLINDICIDKNHQLWVLTMGKGLIKITNNYFYKNPFNNHDSVICVTSMYVNKQNELLIGSYDNYYKLQNQKLVPQNTTINSLKLNYYYGFFEMKSHVFVLQNLEVDTLKNYPLDYNARAACVMNDSQFVCGGWDLKLKVYTIKSNNKIVVSRRVVFSKKQSRINKIIFYKKNQYLVATDIGLFLWDDKSDNVQQLYSKQIQERINDVILYNNAIWLASNKGIIVIKDGIISEILKEGNQSLNDARKFCINPKNNTLFVGTINGLFIFNNNQVSFLNDQTPLNISEISTLSIDTLKNYLYVGSSSGFTKIDLVKFNANYQSKTETYIQKLTSNLSDYSFSNITKPLLLKPNETDIMVDFSGINYNNSPLYFRYSINNNSLIYIPVGSIQLNNISDGEFKLTLQTSIDNINWSKPLIVNIYKQPVFYKTTWFLILIFTLTLIVIPVFFIRLIKRIQQRNSIREQFLKEINLSKIKAINSSTNTHFISNYLVSIQDFIAKNNIKLARDYLALFSRHLRKVLVAVQQDTHSLSNELDIVKEYIQLQEIRFGDKIKAEIKNTLQPQDLLLELPPLIIQPLIENCFTHAFNDLNNLNNHILILIERENSKYIKISVIDNGVGIDNLKGSNQSYGMQSVIQRIELMPQASITITSLGLGAGKTTGTEISLQFYFEF